MCTRMSHDKVDSESRKFTELPGPTETAEIDSKGKTVMKRTRQYSILSCKDTVLCELSENTDSSVVQASGTDMISSRRADEGAEQEVAAVMPKRPIRQCSSPSPSCGCVGSSSRQSARWYSDIFPWGHGGFHLPTIRSAWAHSLLKKRGFKTSVSKEVDETDDVYSPLPRASTSTSIAPLIPSAPSTQSSPAPVILASHPCPPPQRTASILGPIPHITKIHTEGNLSPGVLDSIHEDSEVVQGSSTPDGSDLGISGICRTMSPDRLTSSEHFGLTGVEASSSHDMGIGGSVRKVRPCKKTLPAMHKHGQVVSSVFNISMA